jgi:hypothetical protein
MGKSRKGNEVMGRQEVNRFSGIAPIVMSLIAFAIAMAGTPQKDEGTGAHIFQLLIVAEVPLILLFIATAGRGRYLRAVPLFAVQVGALLLAFGTVYLRHL